MEELLTEAAVFVQELGDFSLREAAKPTARQVRALRFLWEIFRALPSSGTANAVGITKAVKLVTLGRIGPALDTIVRQRLGIAEPRSGEEWITVLRSISADLATFERRHGIALGDAGRGALEAGRGWSRLRYGRRAYWTQARLAVPATYRRGAICRAHSAS